MVFINVNLVSLTAAALLSMVGVSAVTNYNANGLDCNEMCFLDAYTDSNLDKAETERLHQILRLVNKLRAIRIKNRINSTVVSVDTTVKPDHNFDVNRDGIFTFEQHLAALVAFTLPAFPGNPVYQNQFDGDQAWYCNNWSCNSRCAAVENILYDFEDVLPSSAPGLIEDACYLGRKAMTNDYCTTALHKNPLLIAIVNSAFNDQHSKRSKSSHSSSCRKYRHRVIIGTHASEWSQMKDFASTFNSAFYIEDSAEMKKTLANLIDCMQLECCLTYRSPGRGTPTCMRTVAGFDVDRYTYA